MTQDKVFLKGYRHSRKKLSRKILFTIICLVLTLVLGIFSVYAILKSNGRNALKKDVSSQRLTETMAKELSEEIETEIDSELLEEGQFRYQNSIYQYDEDLITILCMGIDTSDSKVKKNIPGNNGQADAIFLILLNEREKTVKLINIPRDIMGEVQEYDLNGIPYGRKIQQIALQFAYGDGQEGSCELMKSLVSEVLYGLPINAYAAINMDAISIINDQVGGVPLLMEADYTSIDPEFKKGETVQLTGDQAHQYVRFRDTSLIGSNLDRINRQKRYLQAFVASVVPKVKKDMSIPLTLFESITRFMTSDISTDEITYLTGLAINSTIDVSNIQILPGTYRQGELYDEFILDENALYDLILQNCYIKVE
jgi:polyisoprenyl-teichoic acid--peptidoglycan teichoic acid transferase